MINSPCEQQVDERVDHPKILSSVSTYMQLLYFIYIIILIRERCIIYNIII